MYFVKKTDYVFLFLHLSIKDQYKLFKKGMLPREAKSKSLSHKEILNYFARALCIIDFPSSFQTGLTMRTFETLAAGKKLITTNKYITNEPFYNPEYIQVIDTDNYRLDVDFIKKSRLHPSKVK